MPHAVRLRDLLTPSGGTRALVAPLALPLEAEWALDLRALGAHSTPVREAEETARTHHRRAWILAHALGRWAEAVVAWRSALLAAPGFVPAHLALREAAVALDDRLAAESLEERWWGVADREIGRAHV